MSADDMLVDVRVQVRASVYRRLLDEARRRRLDGPGQLLGVLVNKQPLPAAKPTPCAVCTPPERVRVDRATIDETVARIEAGELGLREAARLHGVSRAGVHYWMQRAADERAAADAAAAAAQPAAHAAALDELGVTGRPPIPHPSVPSV